MSLDMFPDDAVKHIIEHADSNEVAYYFFRPVVEAKTCSLGKVHRVVVGHTYHTRMTDGQEIEISKEEFDRRPR